MPLYEYQCKKCKHTFEKIQSFSDPPIKKCPKCKGPVEKLLSAPAVQFKGSGWYATDYASKPSSKAAEESSTDGAKTEPAKANDSKKTETPSESSETKKPSKKK
jgi:putative FmdB family regulatory protein